jgi:hypothetical protein
VLFDPLFFLGLSILLVAVSLTAVLMVALPTMIELARAARSVEKLADTLMRELPPTLEAIRLTGLEISDLTDDVSQSVQSAGRVVKRVDDSLTTARSQASRVQVTTRSVLAGVRAAWNSLRQNKPSRSSRRNANRLPPPSRPSMNLSDRPSNGDPDTTIPLGSPPNRMPVPEPDLLPRKSGVEKSGTEKSSLDDRTM